MKIVRGRADARWLPSRHNFALFRLAAYVRLRRATPQKRDVLLVIDRHQSAIENHSVSAWIFATLTCYIAALFAPWPIPLAIAAAVPVAMIVVELPLFIVALLSWNRGGIRVQSIAMMSLLFAAAAWFATTSSWARFVAWQFFGFVALNAIAAVIVFLLRGSIERLEHAVIGGAASEL